MFLSIANQKVLATSLILILLPNIQLDYANAAVYYVDAEHTFANNAPAFGGHRFPFKTISYAVSVADKNDKIFVKAANYGEPNDSDLGVHGHVDKRGITIDKEGLSLIGYSDLNSVNESTGTTDLSNGAGVPDDYHEFPVNKAPTLNGESRSESTHYIGITVTANYVNVRNIRLTNFNQGIYVKSSEDVELENVVIFDVGHNTGKNGDDSTGIGINLHEGTKGSAKVENCFILNASHIGIEIRTDFNVIKDCQVYCDDDSVDSTSSGTYENTWKVAPTDYYFDVLGSNNTIENCNIARIRKNGQNWPTHGGHGYTIQGRNGNVAKENKFVDCKSENIDEFILLRGPGAKENTFHKCISNLIDDEDSDTSIKAFRRPWGSISIAGGPEGNRFQRIRVNNSTQGISYGRVAGGSGTHSSKNNWFENCIFDIARYTRSFNQNNVRNVHNLGVGIKLYPIQPRLLIEDDNYVFCAFRGGNALFAGARAGTGNLIVNSVVHEFDKFEELFGGASGNNGDHGFDLFYDCIFPTADFPDNVTNVYLNPNPNSTYDFSLPANSPCIDKAAEVPTHEGKDYFGGSRLSGSAHDIGPHERQ